jgi:hypothetical protein
MFRRWKNRHRHDWEVLKVVHAISPFLIGRDGYMCTFTSEMCNSCMKFRKNKYAGWLTREELNARQT